jgi:hypothetical protein
MRLYLRLALIRLESLESHKPSLSSELSHQSGNYPTTANRSLEATAGRRENMKAWSKELGVTRSRALASGA